MKFLSLRLLLLLFPIATFLSSCDRRDNKQAPEVVPEGMVFVPAGESEEGEEIDAFFIDKTPVTVAEFQKFVEATKFVTQAERFGDAGVFDVKTGTWSLVKGANYLHPFGPDGPDAQPDHPVTQVSWNDATSYAEWAGKRLPDAKEWFLAARYGLEAKEIYSWGGENWIQDGEYKANFWQGSFPTYNTVEDGFLYTSPVGKFGVNKLGMADMGGNVWQWTTKWKDASVTDETGEKIQVGGSYLCDPAVCHGFKIGNTASSTTETSLCHVGFRCVKALN
ncbi:SUMF1/EgtB/PvdO family nonheme iron enzyme [Persicitalea jodogahamensis]|nr:SUMF1/EgtB/PvdO family nonheme iron enzyme [Persicitalea jodogahamensis]